MSNFTELHKHYGHQVVVAQYTDTEGEPVAVAIECMDLIVSGLFPTLKQRWTVNPFSDSSIFRGILKVYSMKLSNIQKGLLTTCLS